MKTVGIVLAAGASQRMGTPKALLTGADGVPLAVRQAALLCAGGCDAAAVVLGARAAEVRRELPDTLATVENPRWAQGRATSLQAGLGAFPAAAGFLFLPVDAVGVKEATIRAVLAAAEQAPQVVWRPVHRGAKGHLLWIPREAGRELMRLAASARVDEWARPRARMLEVDDPAILRNINTPEEWTALVRAGVGL
jgi:CTP:molybdopterin cytidylyltransferase MocA